MKYVLFIILALVVGLLAGGGIYYWQHKTPTDPETVVTPVQNKPIGTAFSLEQAPINSLRGEIISLTGIPYWESRIATEPAVLREEIAVQQGEKLIASDSGTITVKFASAGSVKLFPKSEIDIIQTLPVNLVFAQKKGKVEYTSLGSSPFSIRSFHLLLTIPKGKVIMNVDDATESITAEVVEGEIIAAFNSPEFVSQTMSASAGQMVYFSDVTRRAEVR